MIRSFFFASAVAFALCTQTVFAADPAAPAKNGSPGADTQASSSTKPVPAGDLAEPKCPSHLTGKQCDAVVSFVVGVDGKTSAVEILSASHPDWGKAVAKAVAKWRFTPGTKDGKPVAMKMKLPIAHEVSITVPGRSRDADTGGAKK